MEPLPWLQIPMASLPLPFPASTPAAASPVGSLARSGASTSWGEALLAFQALLSQMAWRPLRHQAPTQVEAAPMASQAQPSASTSWAKVPLVFLELLRRPRGSPQQPPQLRTSARDAPTAS